MLFFEFQKGGVSTPEHPPPGCATGYDTLSIYIKLIVKCYNNNLCGVLTSVSLLSLIKDMVIVPFKLAM